jgi:hypothetical protein
MYIVPEMVSARLFRLKICLLIIGRSLFLDAAFPDERVLASIIFEHPSRCMERKQVMTIWYRS